MLYFAYTARIAPSQLLSTAPGAEFRFIAHLPEWGLAFPIEGNGWNGSLPSATPEVGRTVWGAVFAVRRGESELIDEVERAEQRCPMEVEAIDRTGQRHRVVTHRYEGAGAADGDPSAEYLTLMLDGSHHWELPAGWIAGLEDRLGLDL